MSQFKSTFDYKLIYVFRINDDNHKGLLKIGDATVHTSKSLSELVPNCKELNVAAKGRINTYTKTASIPYELLHTEIATYTVLDNGIEKVKAFRDKKVHDVLIRSSIERHIFNIENQGTEWFKTDLETAKRAIQAVKNGQASLNPDDISEDNSPIIFRPEQKEAIKATIKQFKVGDRMLWNAKMRFGKTLSALQVAKEMGFKKTLIFTHRPVVSDGWYEDFKKIFRNTDYVFGSKTKGETIDNLADTDKPFVYFASMQDLRGSSAVGGKFDKNEFVFLIDWDYVVVDEAHEGTQTTLGQKVFQAILDNTDKKPKMLELSGTPFNLLSDFKENEIYTWDYIMEQCAKHDWPLKHFGDSNPYEELPQLEIFTYDLDKTLPGYIDVADGAFNFRELFRTWTGDMNKDFKPVPEGVNIGDFVNKNDVWAFLNLLTKADSDNNYPFSTEEYRSYYKHTLWMVPGVKEAKALSRLMQTHPVFGSGAFKIVNVAGDSDEEQNCSDALQAVRDAIGQDPDDHYSVTISCGRLTTGVTVPEWTAVLMLSGTFSTSAANYLQTIFRVQTPANINGRMKERCSVFDFAPDRTLKMVAEAGHLSSKAGNTSNDRIIMGEFLNYCPVIAIDGSTMQPYNVDGLLQQLKKAYTDRVVKNGFDDKHIYNDNLLKLDDIELQDFENLKKIVGTSKQTEKVKDIDINNQGFTDEEYAEIARIEKKPKKERTPEELAKLEEIKKKKDNAQKAMSILRGISIRIPLLIYGAEVPVDQEITVENFVDLIDDSSWNEFMPSGVTKDVYRKFAKYYEQDVFVAAGRQIRNMALAADELSPLERVQKIAEQFTMFKNPDKETVLTPWRVVNMHMSDCLGGWCFYNEDFTETLDEPRFVDHGDVTKDTFANTDAKILEINSKTGLYPLYVTYSIFRKRLDSIPVAERTLEKQYELWIKTVEENVFVICKTPMAKSITKRTLLGYRKGKINAHAFDDLINQLKEKPQQLKEKLLRGGFWNKGVEKMKFNAVVGNPPYQDSSSVNNRAGAIYPYFYDLAESISEKYSIISPARFLFNTGLTSKDWNKKMLSNEHLKVVHFEEDSTKIFPHTDIKGGIAIILYDKNVIFGRIGEFIPNTILKAISNRFSKDLVHNFSSIVYSGRSDLKFTKKFLDDYPQSINDRLKAIQKENLGVSALSPNEEYELKSSTFEVLPYAFLDEKPTDSQNYFELIGLVNGKRYRKWIPDKYMSPRYADDNNIYSYKVLVPESNGSGTLGEVLSTPIVVGPKESSTPTFISIGCFDKRQEANNALKYIKTKFVRTLLGILKKTQHNPATSWAYVPLQDFTDKSDIDWSKSVAEIDQQLYKKYNLDDSEIAFIESTIKPME